jgi:protein SCO1/2
MWPVVAVLTVVGCSRPASPGERLRNDAWQTFQVTGVVMEVEPEKKLVRIKHDEIPGYMKAMIMPFDVKDTNELAGIEPGHPVSFRMTVGETEAWIDQIRITGAKTNVLPTSGAFRVVRDVEPLSEGDLLPLYQFTNQFNQPVSTAQFKGKALAIEFIFTRCPYPTFCPLVIRNFQETQTKLLGMPNAPTNWHLLTLSFDPEFDTPGVLKTYAERHSYRPEHWTFATGALIDVTAIAEQFGLTFWRDAGGIINHNLRAVVIDPQGRVQRILPGNEWTSDELVAELVKAAAR